MLDCHQKGAMVMASADRIVCYKIVEVKGGQCGAASRHCALPVAMVDAFGRGWCKRHAPDADALERGHRIAEFSARKMVRSLADVTVRTED